MRILSLNLFKKDYNMAMEEFVSFSKILQTIKDKDHFSNAELARMMYVSEGSISLYLSNKSSINHDRILLLNRSLLSMGKNSIYHYLFDSFPNGLYHGSRKGIEGPINPFYNQGKSLDFGYGFYLGTSFRQSSTFVASETEGNDRIYRFSIDFNELNILELRNIAWVFFVAYNRKKIPYTKENESLLKQIRRILAKPYDIVLGPIADDKMAISMDKFFNNEISYDQLYMCLTQLKIGDQYCLKTEKACNHLVLESTYICKDRALRELLTYYAFVNTKKASEQAELIVKQPDKGKRFDALLKEYGKKSIL